MKKKEFNRIIGQNISELREAAGFTQDALAERLEISKSFLAHIEQGDRSFSVHTLSSMAEVLGTSADAILFGHTLTSDAIDIAVAMEGLNATDSAVILKVVRDLAAYLKNVEVCIIGRVQNFTINGYCISR